MDEDLFDEWRSAIPEFSDSDRDPDTGNENEDTGERRHWDPHAGMKPSRQDGYASDGEVELVGDLPYGASIEVNIAMIDLMCELGDDDPRDLDWLPPSERKKLEQRMRGMISPHQRIDHEALTVMSRKEEGPFTWPCRHCKISPIATTPRAPTRDEGPNFS